MTGRFGSPAEAPTNTGRPTRSNRVASSAGDGEEARAHASAGEPNRLIRLWPVAEGRCPCCGRQHPVWSAAAIVESFHRFKREFGRVPVAADFSRRGYPTHRRVFDVFGSWTNARDAAGLARPKKRYPKRRQAA